jgi:hypothetical protein
LVPDKRVKQVFEDFHDRKIHRLTLFLEGFGGFSVKRSQDGFVIVYIDRNKRFGQNDHFTVLYDQDGLKGVHRTLSDNTAKVHVRPETTYFTSDEGIKKMLQDMEKRGNVNVYTKGLFSAVYMTLGVVFRQGPKMAEKAKLLDDSEAIRQGFRPPCVYVETDFLQKLLLQVSGANILLQRYLTDAIVGEQVTRTFHPTDLRGAQVTKRSRRR